MSDLSYTFSDYYTKVSEFLGLGSSPTGSNLTKVEEIVYRGYRRFLYATKIDPKSGKRVRHNWSFLQRFYTLTSVDGEWKYALPDDFGRILTDLEYSAGKDLGSLDKRNPEFIISQRNISDSSGYPWYYAIVNSDYDLEIGSSYEIWFYETPNQNYTFNFWYEVNVPKPTDASHKLVGGIDCQETILELCLAVAEQQEEDGASTIHTEIAAGMLQDLIASDTITKGDSLGRMTDPNVNGGMSSRLERNLLTDMQDDNIYS